MVNMNRGEITHYFAYRDSELLMHHTRSERPSEYPMLQLMHAHEYYEILYCIAGDCDFVAEGRDYRLTPGSVLITRPAEVHHVRIRRDIPYERIVINFSDALVEALDPRRRLLEPFVARPQGSLNRYESERLQGALDAHLTPLRNHVDFSKGQPRFDYDTNLTIRIGILCALRELSREFESANSAPGETLSAGNDVLDFINEHLFDRDLSTDLVASRFFISKSQLNRSFNRLTGATVREYVIAKRLIRAKKLIDAGNSASAACEEAGFGDYSAFYRAYRKKFEAPPVRARAGGA